MLCQKDLGTFLSFLTVGVGSNSKTREWDYSRVEYRAMGVRVGIIEGLEFSPLIIKLLNGGGGGGPGGGGKKKKK